MIANTSPVQAKKGKEKKKKRKKYSKKFNEKTTKSLSNAGFSWNGRR
jgi:hypothetical protein